MTRRPLLEAHAAIRDRLEIPSAGVLNAVIDTDTYNEVDDQFAIVFALRSPERLNVSAIYAAPFFFRGAPHFNLRSTSPQDGMLRSYDEIQKVTGMIGRSEVPTYKGSDRFLAGEETPVASHSATDLIERAMSTEGHLYVIALGALTNIASAIIMEPRIRAKIVVVWLGGHELHWSHTREFNLSQDTLATRIVFDSGVALVHVPCFGVASHLVTTLAELEAHIDGRSEIGTYLTGIVRNYTNDHFAWSKPIWDISTVAHLLDESWIPAEVVTSPMLTADETWERDSKRHPIKSAYWADRDPVFRSLFTKINGQEAQHAEVLGDAG